MSTRAIVAVAVGALVAATVLTNSRHFEQVALAPPLPPAMPAPILAPILAPIPVPVLVPVLPAPVAAVEPQGDKATVSRPAQAKPPARPTQKHRPRKQEARKVDAEPRPISRLKPPPPPPALKVKTWGQRLLGHPVDRMSVR